MIAVCSQSGCQTTAGCQCNKNPNMVYQPYSIPFPYYPPQVPNYTQGHTNIQNKGWECPKCGRVYAPCVTECKSCNSINQWGSATSIGK